MQFPYSLVHYLYLHILLQSSSFEAAVLLVLKKEDISVPASQFKVGYAPSKKEEPTSIYDYDLNDIEWSEFEF